MSQVRGRIAALQLPWVVETETSANEAGIVAVTVASDTAVGAALATMIVSTTLDPIKAGLGDAEERTDRSIIGVPMKFTS
jgi:hypothetical protein